MQNVFQVCFIVFVFSNSLKSSSFVILQHKGTLNSNANKEAKPLAMWILKISKSKGTPSFSTYSGNGRAAKTQYS